MARGVAWRLDVAVALRGVERDVGVDPIADCLRAGVEGAWRVLAVGRFAWLAGVVEAGLASGGGDSADERLNGLRTGIAECDDTDLSERAGVFGSFLCGDGVVSDRGLKLCPTTVSRIFVDEFHRGLVEFLSDPGVVERTERVGVLDIALDGSGEAIDWSRDVVSDLRGRVEEVVGRLE